MPHIGGVYLKIAIEDSTKKIGLKISVFLGSPMNSTLRSLLEFITISAAASEYIKSHFETFGDELVGF